MCSGAPRIVRCGVKAEARSRKSAISRSPVSLEEEIMNDHRKNRRFSALRTTAWCVFAATAFAAGSTFAATCESLAGVAIPFTTITTAQTVTGGTFTPPTGAPITGLPDFCRVALVMAPSADSSIRVEVWMPVARWNGRYEGLGGGGYTGSINYA